MISTTLTVRLSEETKDKLGILASQTRRTKSFLAAQAIAAYVDRELSIINGIERGLSERATGKVVTHESAMARIRKTIDKAAQDP